MDVVERRNGRLYLIGLAASLVGNSAMTLVAGIWVKSLTGSSAQAGLVSALVYAPTLAAPVAGLIADRVDRRRWMVVINVASAATILSLLGVRSAREVWLIDVAMTIYGLEEVLLDPAENALFAEIFGDAFRRRINGRRLAIQETGRLVAPLLGAGLFALLSGGAVAALDAATFLVAAWVAARLVIGPRERRAASSTGLIADLAAGVRYVRGADELRRVVIAGAAVMAISAVGVAAQFSLVSAVGEGPAFLGVFSAVLGAGSIGDRGLALAGLLNFAVGNLLRASGSLPLALTGTLVLGFALPWAFLATLNIAQRETPDELLGRVSAAVTIALFGPQAPLQALGAAAITVIGFGEIYIASAIVALAVAAWLATRPRPVGELGVFSESRFTARGALRWPRRR
jgi:MFS family permease